MLGANGCWYSILAFVYNELGSFLHQDHQGTEYPKQEQRSPIRNQLSLAEKRRGCQTNLLGQQTSELFLEDLKLG